MSLFLRRMDRDQRGMTVMELLVGMVVGGVVLVMATGTVIQSMQVQRRQTQQVHSLNQVKTGLERLSRDVRAANPVLVATPTQLAIRVQRQGDERVHMYRIEPDGPDRQRLVMVHDGGTIQALAVDLSIDPANPAFRYYGSVERDATGDVVLTDELTGTFQPELVRAVRVNLRFTLVQTDAPVELSTDVTLRNWGG